MLRIDLRAEAICEAARIRAIKRQPPQVAFARSSGGIRTAVLRSPTAGLHRSVAIFLTRTSIADGSGRLVEELLIPVEVDLDPGDGAERVFDEALAALA